MGRGSGDLELIGEGERSVWSEDFALKSGPESFDGVGRALGEIGEGAFFDLAVEAEGLAEENGWRGIAVGDALDIHGYLNVSNNQ
jgi:hypothetical protein